MEPVNEKPENETLELLKGRMKETTPILLIGAGFSAGSVNGNRNKLKMGKELANELYEHFYKDNPPNELPILKTMPLADYIQQAEEKKDDLSEICTLLSTEGRLNERNEYLKKLYSDCSPDDRNPFQNKLLNYEWRFIFTLNIDDLVENIYNDSQKSLEVWNLGKSGSRDNPGVPLLVKLHGCVSDIGKGFIFDTKEYNQFIADQNALLKTFGHEFLQNDAIIIGTEFQEYDLKIVLDIYKKDYSNKNFHYFFVTPRIHDLSFINEISSNPNMHWIK